MEIKYTKIVDNAWTVAVDGIMVLISMAYCKTAVTPVR